MYPLIRHFFFESVVYHTVLFNKTLALERWRNDEKLPVIATPGQILHFDRGSG